MRSVRSKKATSKARQQHAPRRVLLLQRIGMPLTLFILLVGSMLGQVAQTGFSLGIPTARAASESTASKGKPNRFNPHADTTSVSHPSLGQTSSANAKAGPPISMKRTFPMPMHPGALALAPGHAKTFTGSDGKLELDVPSNAVTSADLAAAGGRLSLEISQIAPASGSSAGGSGLASFGTYLIQLVDAHGALVNAHGLRQPITLKYHYSKAESAFDLTHVFVVTNGSLPDNTALAPLAAPQLTTHGVQQDTSTTPPPTQANSHFGTRGSQNAQLETSSKALIITPLLSSPSTSMSWNTNAPVATFGKPDPYNVDLNAGSLSAAFPIDVPSGPGNLTPPISFAYSSSSVSEQHNPQGAAGWAGEGWDLDLGSISWAEHNVTSGCASTCGNTWEDSWELSDPFGTAAELIPPNINVSTYFDDTPNNYCGADGNANNATSYPCPIRWHTSPENYAKVYTYVGSLTLPDGAGVHPACFRVFLTNGIMEEFGCTTDSLEYYYVPGMGDYISSWKLDLITDPRGNQIHITYTRDVEQKSVSGVNHSYIRDAVLNTVEWDSPSCHNAQSMCTGSSWAPLMRVSFAASHAPVRPTNWPTGCNTGANLRCDDPLNLSGSGGLAAPDVQSTFVLNDLYVQVRNSGTGTWNTLKDYQFSYAQGSPTTITDPSTGKQESTAGYMVLGGVTPVGDDGSTALPSRKFDYTSNTEYYEDDIYHPNPATNCGPSWNTGNGSGCLLWSQSYQGNSYYLSGTDNGIGLSQYFLWDNARNNTHGVNGGGSNNVTPLYCNTHQTGYPCNEADDENWSQTVLTQRESDAVRAASGGNVTVQSITHYGYKLATATAKECSDCVSDMYWGNINDGDYLDYYNGKFMGFAEADVTNPDGSYEVHKFNSTLGYGIYDTGQVGCFAAMKPVGSCTNDPWWNVTNAAHGREIEADYYDTNGTTLLKKATTQYAAVCPPSGVSGTPASGTYGTWDSKLVSELDHNNPVAACAIQTTRTDQYTYDGASGTVPQTTTTYTYDAYGRTVNTTTNSNGGGAGTNSPTTIVQHTDYIWNDSVTAQYSSVTGTYLISFPADAFVEDSGNTAHYSCGFTNYDTHAFAIGQQSTFTLGEATTKDQYSNCGTSTNGFATSGLIRTTSTYDTWGNQITTTDPDANAGNSAHKGCTVSSVQYSTCTAFDGIFHTLTTSTTNALNQSGQSTYGTPAASNGFGLWPTSTIDGNGQATTYTYDALGRLTSQTDPGETSGLTSAISTYTLWCNPSGGLQAPCVEVDQTQRLNSTTTVTSRAFYDGNGNLVETRDPAPNGEDIIHYLDYDPSGRTIFDSTSYLVTAYTGAPGAAAFSTPDSSQPGTTTVYDGLGRTTQATDALSHVATTAYTVECGMISDTACYAMTIVVDADSHEAVTFTDALGREIYNQTFTGNSASTYSVYTTSKYGYGFTGNLTTIWQPNSTITTTSVYDAAGRTISMTDPDRGTESFSYDASGNLIESVDARGSAGTVYMGYDGVNRPIWRNTTNSPTGAYVTYSYDSTANGNYGVGQLTDETFVGGPNRTLTGSYSYVYDQRSQEISETETVGTTNYTVGTTYDDAGNVLTQTYPDGEVVTNGYSGEGWLSQVATSQGSTTLLSAADYSGTGGAAHLMTGATLGGGLYHYSASYDDVLHLTDARLTRVSDGATLWDETRNFDASSNLTQLTTTMPGGTDDQSFCYDEQNRLTWASSQSATGPCGIVNTAGSLITGNSQYTSTYNYDTYGRLTSGPLGTYTYGDSAHLHAATAIGTSYSASYDAAGNMGCRAPSASSTCAGGTPTGASMNYDNEGQLTTWQDVPSNPTTTDNFLYDGEGNRIEQQVTQGGVATTNIYLGSLEEISVTGGTTTTTTYYYANGQRIAVGVNGVITFLMSDALGSAKIALDSNGNVSAAQLYDPYGNSRYQSGTLPGSYGYTGQHTDDVTGLDYYNARYYDPLASQFVSADSILPGGGYDPWGLSRYAYVEGNPETRNDPTGHIVGCVLDMVHTAMTGDGLLGTIGTCGSEVAQSFRAERQAQAATQLLNMALAQYKSGNYIYLENQAGVELDGLTSPSAMANVSLSSLRNPLNAVGYGDEPVDYVVSTVKAVLNDGARTSGVGGGASRAGELTQALDDASQSVDGIKVAGKVLGIAGAVATTVVSGLDDYSKHQDAGRAVIVGLTHGILSTGGAWLGGALGGALGSLIAPGPGTVIGSFIGASVGGWLGDQAAGFLVDQYDNGNMGAAYNTVTSTLSDAGSAIGSIMSNFGF